jgi:hypothetical protein
MAEFTKFDEYNLFVNDTARFSERRQTISNIHVTINSLLLTVIGLLIKDAGGCDVWSLLLPLPMITAGIFVSWWWCQLIHKYKTLINLRIDTLHKMENEIPGLVKMYHIEDRLYPRDENGMLIPKKGLNFSDLESRLPILFIILYCLFGVGSLLAIIYKMVC